MHYQEWGVGDPLIALHPLALESTAYAGVAGQLETLGLRTLAVDLPGFGLTLAPEGPLTPAVLAEPVIELASRLEKPPLLMGMSLGGRVALEVALTAPEVIRGVVLVAPYMPWRNHRNMVAYGEHLDPAWAENIPLERIWPMLQRTSKVLESIPALENDWLTRACVRVAYYLTCPATRTAFFSAARELAIDPAYGPDGLWDRLPKLEVPNVFLWAGRDKLIPSTHAEHVAEALPQSPQMEVPCSGHFVNFTHYRCMERAMTLAVSRLLDPRSDASSLEAASAPTITPCLAGLELDDILAGEPGGAAA
jgi:pimeloyl-ACP methyl ester carboxylesterase